MGVQALFPTKTLGTIINNVAKMSKLRDGMNSLALASGSILMKKAMIGPVVVGMYPATVPIGTSSKPVPAIP